MSTIRIAVAGRCPAEFSLALHAAGAQVSGPVPDRAELARLTDVYALVCFVDHFGPRVLELLREPPGRYLTVVVGTSAEQAGTAIAAGAHAFLRHVAGTPYHQLAALVVAAARPTGGPVRPAATGSAAERLSERERETLAWIAAGYTHQQTARRMSVSKSTVDTYIARVRGKLGVGNKAELALAAVTVLHASPRPAA
jgi:DNA-binding CsgD family transcriptional regulator